MRALLGMASLAVLAASAAAAADSAGTAKALLLTAHKGASLAPLTAPAAKLLNTTPEGEVQGSHPLRAADLRVYTEKCALFDWGHSDGAKWMLSWKCGDQYRMMEIGFTGARVGSVAVSEGPPWMTDAPEPYPAFPQTVSSAQ